jgi:ribosomal protein S18 acetylase RimI-like enzyme
MRIEKAQEVDATEVTELFHQCVQHLIASGSDQWSDVYPDAATISDDIRDGSLYLATEDAKCAGIVVLNEVQSPEYASLQWLCDGPRVLVVHRLAVRPAVQGRGIGGRLMDFAEQYAAANRYDSIRLDAYTGNPPALCLYEGRGYIRTGQVFFPRRTLPFNCYEKVLTPPNGH